MNDEEKQAIIDRVNSERDAAIRDIIKVSSQSPAIVSEARVRNGMTQAQADECVAAVPEVAARIAGVRNEAMQALAALIEPAA